MCTPRPRVSNSDHPFTDADKITQMKMAINTESAFLSNLESVASLQGRTDKAQSNSATKNAPVQLLTELPARGKQNSKRLVSVWR